MKVIKTSLEHHTATLANGVGVSQLTDCCIQLLLTGETVVREDRSYQLTTREAPDAMAFVVVTGGGAPPAELSDDDISATTPRAASVLRQAWRELVAHNS